MQIKNEISELDPMENFDNDNNYISNIKDIKGKIEFKNVSFGYSPEVQVLKNISFEINIVISV